MYEVQGAGVGKLWQVSCLFIKFYWNTAMPIHVSSNLPTVCFQTAMVELSSKQRLYVPQSQKHLLFGPVEKKFIELPTILTTIIQIQN